MKQKVIITTCHEQTVIAFLENERIAELHYCPKSEESTVSVGDIYVGRVKKILSNIHAAFIEIIPGLECYYPLNDKDSKPVREGDELLVQVAKEAQKTKQPTVTTNLSFKGQYAVLTSGNHTMGVSKRIEKERKSELSELLAAYNESDFGIILRTNAGTAPSETIIQEIEALSLEYHRLEETARTRTCYSCIKHAPRTYLSILKDIYTEFLEEIVTDDTFFQEVKDFLSDELPELLPKLRNYTDKNYTLSSCYNISRSTEQALRERVWLDSGAYLVIQPTEAMTVIDVNSGKCIKKKTDFFHLNQEAAFEIAHQVRLRNLSGIIMIDFINMRDESEQKELLKIFQDMLAQDRNPGKVIDMTKLGLVEVTRKKIRKTLAESISKSKTEVNE